MMSQDKVALASRPDLFTLVPSTRGAKNGRTIAWAQAIPFLLAGGWLLLSGSGKAVLGLVLLAGGAVAFLALRKWAADAKEWAMRDGRALTQRKLALREDAEESWRRLATGDVSYYTPIKVEPHPNGSALHQLHAFWPHDGERVTYLSITAKYAKDADRPEIVELRDLKHDQFHAALAQGLYKKFSG